MGGGGATNIEQDMGTRILKAIQQQNDAEPCRVPIQSTFVEIVPFDNKVMPDRLLTRSEDSMLQMEMPAA